MSELEQIFRLKTADGGVLTVTAQPGATEILVNANRAGDFQLDAADVQQALAAALPPQETPQ
jgi:hypothetical protein